MPDFAPLLERAFDHIPAEGACRITAVEGNLPDWLCGSYFVNGPAKFRNNGVSYSHWLDGDGMVCALHFKPNAVDFTARFVRSTKFAAEQEAGKALFRTFGTSFDGDRMKRGVVLESPVNVSVYPFAGRLLAFGEQGLPWSLDPWTLETIGLHDFNGGLNELSPFSAHPKVDPRTGEMFNFGIAFAATEPGLNLYRFGPDGCLAARRRIAMVDPCSVHDFALTPRFAVVYAGPYLLNMTRLRTGGTVLDALEWRPDMPARLLIVDRESGTLKSVILDSGYTLHLIDAFDDGRFLTVDLLLLDRPIYDEYQPVPALFRTVSRGRPVRLVLDLKTGQLAGRRELPYDLAPDFAQTDKRRFGEDSREFWMLGISSAGRDGRKFFDHLVHGVWEKDAVSDVWQTPPGHYLGSEPVFVGDPGDKSKGAVIVHVFDAFQCRSSFQVFNAADVASGPIASIALESPLHLAFHACFVA